MTNGDGGMPPKALSAISGTVGLCGGLLISWFTSVADLAVLTERVSSIDRKIVEQMDDRYRGTDARKDQEILMERIGQNAKHIKELERLLREHASNTKEHNGDR